MRLIGKLGHHNSHCIIHLQAMHSSLVVILYVLRLLNGIKLIGPMQSATLTKSPFAQAF